MRTRASWQAWWEGSKPANRERGKALASASSATPPPQPTSATRAPAWSLSTTPSSLGSSRGTRAARTHGPSERAVECAPAAPNASYGRPTPVRNALAMPSTTAGANGLLNAPAANHSLPSSSASTAAAASVSSKRSPSASVTRSSAAPLARSHSRTSRSASPVRSASSAEVSGPAPCMAR